MKDIRPRRRLGTVTRRRYHQVVKTVGRVSIFQDVLCHRVTPKRLVQAIEKAHGTEGTPWHGRACTMARIDQVGDSIYRISVFTPEKRISFNQFVIDDERPALVHTGMYPMYEEVRAAVSQVLDPSRLAYVIVPHFEADECGGMGRFVAEAKQAVLVCSAAGARINLL
jgi:hypothetical protein